MDEQKSLNIICIITISNLMLLIELVNISAALSLFFWLLNIQTSYVWH